MKVWDLARIELATPGSVVRHVTGCATPPCTILSTIGLNNFFFLGGGGGGGGESPFLAGGIFRISQNVGHLLKCRTLKLVNSPCEILFYKLEVF